MTPVSPAIQSIVQLFQGPLEALRFGNVDATALTQLASEVETAAGEVERKEAELLHLRQELAQRQEALLVLAQRALAYAKVYAENDESLSEQLNRITLPRAAKPRKPSAAPSPARAAREGEPTSESQSESQGESAPGGESQALDESPERVVSVIESDADPSEVAQAAVPRKGKREKSARSAQASST